MADRAAGRTGQIKLRKEHSSPCLQAHRALFIYIAIHQKCKVRAFFVLEEERTFSYWLLEPNHRLSAELARG